jgi:chorismate mutase
MTCRGIRGAITVKANGAGAILAATRTLLEMMTSANRLQLEDIASIIFTATPDLDAVYPARAAREMGWLSTPLLCMQEMAVAGSLPHCIRVLVLWNTELGPEEIHHVYLEGAKVLRPDLAEEREK